MASKLISLLLGLLVVLCLLSAGVSGGGKKYKARYGTGYLPSCGIGEHFFDDFLKCDASLHYCFEYKNDSCVGPPNWVCVHNLNRAADVESSKHDSFIKNVGYGNTRCCGGRYQSPIDIPLESMCHPGLRTRVPFYANPLLPLKGVYENSGYYSKFYVENGEYNTPLVARNFPFTCTIYNDDRYVFSNIHIHAGIRGKHGSAHFVKGKTYDGEFHLVHVHSSFYRQGGIDMKCASQSPLGLAVIGVFLSLTEGEPNAELNKLLSDDNLEKIKESHFKCDFEDICDPDDDSRDSHDDDSSYSDYFGLTKHYHGDDGCDGDDSNESDSGEDDSGGDDDSDGGSHSGLDGDGLELDRRKRDGGNKKQCKRCALYGFSKNFGYKQTARNWYRYRVGRGSGDSSSGSRNRRGSSGGSSGRSSGSGGRSRRNSSSGSRDRSSWGSDSSDSSSGSRSRRDSSGGSSGRSSGSGGRSRRDSSSGSRDKSSWGSGSSDSSSGSRSRRDSSSGSRDRSSWGSDSSGSSSGGRSRRDSSNGSSGSRDRSSGSRDRSRSDSKDSGSKSWGLFGWGSDSSDSSDGGSDSRYGRNRDSGDRSSRGDSNGSDSGDHSDDGGSDSSGDSDGGDSGNGRRAKKMHCLCRRRNVDELLARWSGVGRGEGPACRGDVGSPHPCSQHANGAPCGDGVVDDFWLRPGLLLPRFRGYYQYFGSLTTPPCSEVVNWIVMKQPIRVTEAQLEKLRKLKSRRDDVLISKYGDVRPVQPLNGRRVLSTC